jgi:THO complex subunit 5
MTISEPRIQDADPVINALANLVAPNCTIVLDSEEGQAYADSLFAKLKALNRQAHATVREYKQETSEARALMDESLLKLQNLLYEKRHLEKEIEKCREYGQVFK